MSRTTSKDALAEIVGNVESDVIVETSVDAELQTAAERALTEELAAKAEKLDASQGAMIAMTPDGAVRALVGGKNYSKASSTARLRWRNDSPARLSSRSSISPPLNAG